MKHTGKHTKVAFDADGYQADMDNLNGEALPGGTSQWKPLHGGVRVGAGRKPSGKVPVSLRLKPSTVRHLRAVAKRQGKTMSEVAERQLVGA